MSETDARRTEVARVEPRGEVTEVRPETVPEMVRLALTEKVPVEMLERILDLQERVAARDARAAYVRAMSEFQAECPVIRRSQTASIVTKSGARYSYTFSPLDEMVRTVRPILHRHGFSYTWDSSIGDGERMRTVCRLRHVEGHEETATFEAPTETAAGMSGAQKYAAALTFGRRQTLVQVLGLTTGEPDTDGAPAEPREPITPEQEATLRAMVREVGADEARFVAHMARSAGTPLESLADIPADLYQTAIRLLEDKRRAAS